MKSLTMIGNLGTSLPSDAGVITGKPFGMYAAAQSGNVLTLQRRPRSAAGFGEARAAAGVLLAQSPANADLSISNDVSVPPPFERSP